MLNKRDDYVKEHCIELRNNVQLVAEEAIQQNIYVINVAKKLELKMSCL